VQIVDTSFPVDPLSHNFGVATCPAGKQVIGGGYSTGYDSHVLMSYPSAHNASWNVTAENTSNAYTLVVHDYAVCATAA
jgi:hypothetical protein